MRPTKMLYTIGAMMLMVTTAQAQGAMGGMSAPAKKDAMGDGMKKMDTMETPMAFMGEEGHMVAGHMKIAMKNGKTMVQLADDFKVEKNSNLDLVLSPDMMYSMKSAVMVGKVTKMSGMQEFALPAGTMTDHFAYAIIRDRRSGKVIGMAKLAGDGMMKDDGMMKKSGGK